MQPPPSPLPPPFGTGTAAIRQIQLCIQRSQASPCITLSAPPSSLERMVSYMKRIAQLDPSKVHDYGIRHIWPIFVFSARRATSAHLNWTAPHVLGTSSAHPPPIIVINPDEEAAYRANWPGAILCIVPLPNRGISFCRWIVHCAFSWRLPYYWSFDDNIIAFVSVDRQTTTPITFADALLRVQRLSSINSFAVAGFLRATGTETTKVKRYIIDRATIYKVLLVNTAQCAGCNYTPILRKWEDIAFLSDLFEANRHMLKVQCIAYHAVTTHGGGCAPDRVASCGGGCAPRSADSCDALVHSWATNLTPHQTATVQKLSAWAARHNSKAAPASITINNSRGRTAHDSKPSLPSLPPPHAQTSPLPPLAQQSPPPPTSQQPSVAQPAAPLHTQPSVSTSTLHGYSSDDGFVVSNSCIEYEAPTKRQKAATKRRRRLLRHDGTPVLPHD